MAAEENRPKSTPGAASSSGAGSSGGSSPTTGGTAGASSGNPGQKTAPTPGGQQISGEQIFSTTEQKTAGGESFATTSTGATPTGGSSSGGAGAAAKPAGESTAGATSVKEVFNQAKDQTKEVASQAFGQVQEKATTAIDSQKSNLAQGLTSVAEGLRQMTGNLREAEQQTPIAQFTARYGESLTEQVEQISRYLDERDVNQMLRDVESFARRNPAVFVGSAFALGMLAARFLKSSSGRRTALQTRETTRQINQMSETVAHGEPPPLGRTLPSVESPTPGTANQSSPTTGGTTATGTTGKTGAGSTPTPPSTGRSMT
jgi:hypothetical protein